MCVSWEGEGWFRTRNIELCHPWSKLLTWHASAQFWFIFIIWFLLPPFFLSSLYLWFFTLNERGGTCILLCFPLHGCYFNVFLPAVCVCVSCEWEGDGWFRTGNIVPSPNLGGNCFATMEPANYLFFGWLPLPLVVYDRYLCHGNNHKSSYSWYWFRYVNLIVHTGLYTVEIWGSNNHWVPYTW